MTLVSSKTVATSVAGSWIDGAPVVTGGGLHQVINPATGEPVADYALATPADVDRAVASARKALSGWLTSITAIPARAKCRARPAPYEPVPSTPARSTRPNDPAQPTSRAYPAAVAGTVVDPSTPPTESITAATWNALCVSTPTTTSSASDRPPSRCTASLPSSESGAGVSEQGTVRTVMVRSADKAPIETRLLTGQPAVPL